MSQPAEVVDDFLEHYGVKGMRWGIRKAHDEEPRNSEYSSRDRDKDEADFGRRAVSRINREMNAGKTHKEARRKQFQRQMARDAIVLGATYAAIVSAPHAANGIHNRAETNRGAAAARNLFADQRGLRGMPSLAPRDRQGVWKITDL